MRARDPLIDADAIRRLYAYVAFRVGDGPDAEDVTGDTIERALRYRRSYDPSKGPPIAWLVGIARRRIATHVSKPALLVPLEIPDATAAAGDLEEEAVARLALNAAVARLAERDRELVSLHYGADLTPAQIADLLDLRPNAVEVALYRARSRLRALLEREAGWAGQPSESGEETVSL